MSCREKVNKWLRSRTSITNHSQRGSSQDLAETLAPAARRLFFGFLSVSWRIYQYVMKCERVRNLECMN